MSTVFARKALLAEGWANIVRLHVRAGNIENLEVGVAPDAKERQADVVIPGLCNAHSHSFQRALVGRTEQRSPDGEDNFWSWRVRMYELANKIDARQLAAIVSHGSRREALTRLDVPTLVIHGAADPLVPVAGGRDTAAAIPGAELLVVEGMGHDLPPGAWPTIVPAIERHTQAAG